MEVFPQFKTRKPSRMFPITLKNGKSEKFERLVNLLEVLYNILHTIENDPLISLETIKPVDTRLL